MTATELLERAERVIEDARGHRERAAGLRRIAGSLRADILTRTRQQPYRHVLRLAQGGSEEISPPAVAPTETVERRCPYCDQAGAIRPLGRIEVAGEKVRSMYCCGTCDRAFVYVRRALGWGDGSVGTPSTS